MGAVEDIKRRMRAARLSWHTLDGLSIQLRRPNMVETVRFSEHIPSDAKLAGRDMFEASFKGILASLDFVTDWKATTSDFVELEEGETPRAVEFDAELLRDLIPDRPALGAAIFTQIVDMIATRHAQREQEKKVSNAGLSTNAPSAKTSDAAP